MRDDALILLLAVLTVSALVVYFLPFKIIGLFPYVLLQVAHVATVIAIFKLPAWSARHPQFFYSVIGISMVLATAIALGHSASLPGPLRTIPISLGVVVPAGIAAIVGYYLAVAYEFNVPRGAYLPIALASAFLFCATLTLCSMAAPLSRVELIVRSCLGLAWLFHGLYGFVVVLGFVRAVGFWKQVNDVLPTAVSIVLFGLMTAGLMWQQRELTRAGQRDPQVEQLRLAPVMRSAR